MSWNNQDNDNNNDNKGGGDKKNPWGKPHSGGSEEPKNPSGQNPWGKPTQPQRNSGSNNNSGNDFDELVEKINDFFNGKNGGASNGFSGRFFLFALAGVVTLWLLSGFYRVLPEEHGVILRFGEWQRTQTNPGLSYHYPWPIETIEKPNVTFQRRVEVGFRGNATGRTNGGNISASSDIPEESLMLTGDENIIDIDFVVVWNVKDARNFLYKIRDPEGTIKKVAESAMREVIGQTEIQPALTKERPQIEVKTKEAMQKMLDEYQSGIYIAAVQLQKVDPPSQVVDAFNEVQRARADKERLGNEAEAYRNDIIPRARGASEKLIQDAEAYKAQVINQAQGDGARFDSVYKAYALAKDVTAKRMYLETIEGIFGNAQKIVLDKGASNSGMVPYLPLNELKAKETTKEKSGE